jgi:hypothetical protein
MAERIGWATEYLMYHGAAASLLRLKAGAGGGGATKGAAVTYLIVGLGRKTRAVAPAARLRVDRKTGMKVEERMRACISLMPVRRRDSGAASLGSAMVRTPAWVSGWRQADWLCRPATG